MIALACVLSGSALAHAGDDKAADLTPLKWASATQSPRFAAAAGSDARLYRLCGERDTAMVQVAAAIVRRRIDGKRPFDERALRTLTRAAGVPQLWPHAWSLAGVSDARMITAKMKRWLGRRPAGGVYRCGIARGVTASGKPVIAAVNTRVLADLAPLPRRMAVSRWLSLSATLHVSADHAKVVLLGPRGRPKRVLASLSHGTVRSRFMLDQRGRWLVQVVAGLPSGPKPVAEAVIFVGAKPPAELEVVAAKAGAGGDVGTLLTRLNKARASEGLGKLQHDRRLDKVALAHARAMARARRVAHDVGDGSPDERVEEARIAAHRVGENVASAPTIERIHAALWESPSHRENMLDASFRRVGVAAVADATGKLWAVQLYAD